MAKYVLDIETTSLDPINGVISCISILNIDTLQYTSFSGEDEKLILHSLINFFELGDVVIGFNILSFDINYIRVRSFINEIKNKDVPIKVIDIRNVINQWNLYNKGKLRDYAKIFNIPVETENGLAMINLYKEKKFLEISKHCEEDCFVTYKIYQKLEELGYL